MTNLHWNLPLLSSKQAFLFSVCLGLMISFPFSVEAESKIEIMQVDEVKAGMEGVGKTVIQGTTLVPFKVKILGVMRNVSPGRDLILSQLSGANLEKTGVIAGMSGSPVYIDGKLLGAVAYAWSFSKEPVAGITPFVQMRDTTDKRPMQMYSRYQPDANGSMPVAALDLNQDPFLHFKSAESSDAVQVMQQPAAMTPIAIPLSATGFGPNSLSRLKNYLQPFGMMPVANGAATSDVKASEPVNPIVPGGALACGLITGDMDLTGIGTVTHVDGDKVWGWGHPMMSSGSCHFLLRAAHIHMVNSRASLSTKMGSPLSIQGVINADVGTCIAGRLGAEPDLLPIKLTVKDQIDQQETEYNVKIVRHPALLGPLVASVMTNSLEDKGQLPDELTVGINATIHTQDLPPIQIQNRYSGVGMSGTSGVSRILNQVAIIVNGLTRNPFGEARIKSIECTFELQPERTSAAIESARLSTSEVEAGDDLTVIVRVQPYKQESREVPVSFKVPTELPTGTYTMTICDRSMHLRQHFAEHPYLLDAKTVPQVADAFRAQLEEDSHTLFLRIPLKQQGVSVEGVELPQLPASVRSILSTSSSLSKSVIKESHVQRHKFDWILEGTTSLNFKVVEHKRTAG